jgi:hypothetical protein
VPAALLALISTAPAPLPLGKLGLTRIVAVASTLAT